jgi:hypothetical protein
LSGTDRHRWAERERRIVTQPDGLSATERHEEAERFITPDEWIVTPAAGARAQRIIMPRRQRDGRIVTYPRP